MEKKAISPSVFLADGVRIIGQVSLQEHSSVWYNAVLRGDEESISIGARSNIQDGCVLHTDSGFPMRIGNLVSIGHGAILHGCEIGDNSLIGMGAILLNGCKIGSNCMIGAGSLLLQGTVVPDGHLALGHPAKVIRPLKPEEIDSIRQNAQIYQQNAMLHLSSPCDRPKAEDGENF